MAKFESRTGKGPHADLYIDGKKVLKGWESFTGWYWFAVEKTKEEYNGKPIWFGFVQGTYEEWGYFAEGEIDSLGMRAWRIKACDMPYAGRRWEGSEG